MKSLTPSSKARPEEIAQSRTATLWSFLGWGSIAFLVLSLWAYGPALNGPFVFDDYALPFRNPAFKGRTLETWINTVRPVLMASYWMNFRISGRESTLSYHLINLIIHFLNTLLAGAILLRLLLWTRYAETNLSSQAALLPPRLPTSSSARKEILLAIFGAGVFLLHPLQTESVAYIAGRSESFSAFFVLAALTVFLYRSSITISWGAASAVMLLFAAALATKEHTVALAGILVITDLLLFRKTSFEPIRRNWRLYAPLGVGAGMAIAAAFWVLQRSDSAGFAVAGLPWNHYFFSQLRAWLFYIWLFVSPAGLTVDHDFAVSTTLLQHGSALAACVWIVGVAAALIYFRKYLLAGYGLLFYLILLAPTSSFVPIKDLVAEHRMYLPMLGLILVAMEALRRMRVASAGGVIGMAGILVILGNITYDRSKDWADPVRLWNGAIAAAPAKVRPYSNLASYYLAQRQCPQAVEVANRAPAALDGKEGAYLLATWGLALDCTGRKPQAIQKLQAAAALQPSAPLYAALGRIHVDLGELPEAEAVLAQAERLDPKWEMTYVYRGLMYGARNEFQAATAEFTRVLALNPDNSTARELLIEMQRRMDVALPSTIEESAEHR